MIGGFVKLINIIFIYQKNYEYNGTYLKHFYVLYGQQKITEHCSYHYENIYYCVV
jgi:hypothetical protein